MTSTNAKKLASIQKILADPFAGYQLSVQERRVATFAAHGLTLQEIGKLMGISKYTAGSFTQRVGKKTGLGKNEFTRHMLDQIEKVLDA